MIKEFKEHKSEVFLHNAGKMSILIRADYELKANVR
jgi:hypothetical protein